jgi:hypothetical protein
VTFSTAGDGLVRPLNAPPGQQVLPGVQPGVSGQVVLAQYVIVFGNTAGGGSGPGIYVYAAGSTPGPGNPPILSMSNATEDPYGNTIAPGIWAGPFGGTQAGLEFNGTEGQLLFPVAGTTPTLVGGIAGIAAGSGGSEVQIFSAIDAGSGSDRVFIVLADHNAVGSSAAYFIVYEDANGNGFQQVQGGAAGLNLASVASLTAVLPGTGTSNTNAAQPETWHNLVPDAGWTIVEQPQYRLLPGTGVQVTGLMTHAGTAARTVINSANPIPAAYQPSVTRYYRTPMPSPDLAGSVEIDPGGEFFMRASGFTATQAILDGIYAL